MSRYYIYDSYTDEVAEFAKRKDNRRRNAMIAGGAGATVVGGALAPITYGGYRMARDSGLGRGNAALSALNTTGKAVGAVGRGAYGAAREVAGAYGQAYKEMGKDIYKRGRAAAGGAYRRGRASAGRAWGAVTTGSGVGGSNAGILREPLNRIGNVWKSGKVGKAAILGSLAAAGYAGYRAKKNADRRRKSVRGRVRALLGR